MARIAFFLILMVGFFVGGYQASRSRFWEKKKTIVPAERTFQPTLYPIENLPFAVVIFGRNHGAWIEKSIESVFAQNYTNFRVIYIDDGSDDGSFELARDLVAGHNVTILRNETEIGLLASLGAAMEQCEGTEIVVLLNGEDWLAHEWVLQRLNQYYANPDLWMTSSPTLAYPSYLPKSSPFSTFYAALFLKKEEQHTACLTEVFSCGCSPQMRGILNE